MMQMLIVLILLGLLLYIVQLLPIDPTVKKIIVAIAIVCVAIWVLTTFFPALLTHPPRR